MPTADSAKQNAKKAASAAGESMGWAARMIGGLPGHMGRAALDPTAYFVPKSLSDVMARSPTASFIGKSFGEAFGIDYTAKGISEIGENRGFMSAKGFHEAWHMAKVGDHMGAGGMAFRATGAAALGLLSLYGTYHFASEGYKEGGVSGAIGGVAQSVGIGMAFRKTVMPVAAGIWGYAKAGASVGFHAKIVGGATPFLQRTMMQGIGASIFGGIGGAFGAMVNPYTLALGAGIYGYYKLQEYVQDTDRAIARDKQVRGLELGAPIQDAFGTISTLRQRSLQAIQNTHVNGRMAFGNEAALLHSSY